MYAKRQPDAADVSSTMDFKSNDEAWYTVRIRLLGDKLFVLYCDFPQESDETFSANEFADIQSVEEFRRRFRPLSSQLQDRDCDEVAKGKIVCAANRFAVDDLRFFDAVVESVNPSIHGLQEGTCRCKFELLWLHGPQKGQKNILGIEHVCIIKSGETVVNLTLEKFLDIVKEKLKVKDNLSEPKLSTSTLDLTQDNKPASRLSFSPVTNSTSTSQIPNYPILKKSKKDRQDFCSSMVVYNETLSSLLRTMEMKTKKEEKTPKRVDEPNKVYDLLADEEELLVVRQNIRNPKPEETANHIKRGGSSSESMINYSEHDFDMGGQSLRKCQHFKQKRTYFCRIDNLEKDLSPITLAHFVEEHLGIPCLAFICPCTWNEFCTRGFILLEEIDHANKIMDFFLNTEYIIVSMKGRPWIIDDTCFGIAEGIMPTYEVKPSDAEEELKVQIKVVQKGTPEYEKVEKLRLLHSDFQEHIHVHLLPRLLADESKLIMNQLTEE